MLITKELHNKHNEPPFLPEKMKLTNGIEKLTCNLYDKEKYVVHIRKLQQALKHGLILKKVHRVIEYKQSAWLKPYIDIFFFFFFFFLSFCLFFLSPLKIFTSIIVRYIIQKRTILTRENKKYMCTKFIFYPTIHS